MREAVRDVVIDRALALDDFVDSPGRDLDDPRKADLAGPLRGQEFFQQNPTRVNRRHVLCCHDGLLNAVRFQTFQSFEKFQTFNTFRNESIGLNCRTLGLANRSA